ncbi:dihydropteroate synthase [Halobellus rufus]|uniref:dihydropteroate synthase n=1 Tax=Halobellus rufus TaxID=1448860 RepID=UPI00067867CF|nr:dihydropteroate synthase [Halobellus rufus]
MRTVDAAGLEIGDEHPPRIMGVLNVSKESPYDPSVFDDPGEAAEYVDRELVDEGADIVDVGLESANKRFEVLSAEEELERLDTAVETIESVSGDAVFSIETRYHEVADAALSRGFDMVNDICGFADPEMPRVCADYDVAVAKMASPPDLTRPGAVESVDWAARGDADRERSRSYADDVYDALSLNGFTDKTIVDPAFGGWSEEKSLEDDRETFRRLREFRGLGYPILVSINRKNFLREIAGRSTEAALPVSLAATSMAVERGARIVRTHDVEETRDAALVGYEFARSRIREAVHDSEGGGVAVEELDVTTPREAERHLDRVGAESPSEAAKSAVVRAFELSGLSDPAVGRLSTAATDAGVTVVSDPAAVAGAATDGGEHGSTSDAAGRSVLLFGTPAAYESLEARVREFDGDGGLRAALELTSTAD